MLEAMLLSLKTVAFTPRNHSFLPHETIAFATDDLWCRAEDAISGNLQK